MKKNIFKSMLAMGAIVALASCSENSWNNEALDGFTEPGAYPDKMATEYVLTAADYKAIAGNSENIEKATEAGLLAELTAVGTNGYFSDAITAAEYLPAFINANKANTKYNWYYLNPKSALTIKFKTRSKLTAEMTDIETAPAYTLSTADYQAVYGSETNYAESFAPSYPAAKSIPGILATAYPNAEKGQYAYVTYNVSAQDPVFGGSAPEAPKFELSNTIKDIALNVETTVNGVVTAICAQGYIVTDASGSAFIYVGSAFDMNSVAIGSQVTVTGTGGAYNGGLQLATPTTEVQGKAEAIPYPKAQTPDADAWKAIYDKMAAARTDKTGEAPVYVELKDAEVVKAATSESNGKTYIDIYFSYAGSTIQAQVYQPTQALLEQFTEGAKVTVAGFLSSVYVPKSGDGRIYIIPSAINGKQWPAAAAKAPRKVATVASTPESAVYTFNGKAWAAAKNVVVLGAADYAAMGLSNLNATQAAANLPIFLKGQFPYAKTDDVKYVVYTYYNGKAAVAQHCDRAVFDGTTWVINTINDAAEKFALKGSEWVYDPSVILSYPSSGKPQATKDFLQACVNWVFENIDAKAPINAESITSGVGYVSKYGNNDYYGGASAYYCNVDIDATAAKAQYAAGFTGLSDEQIVTLLKKRFEKEVVPGVLATLYPDQKPGDGVDLFYTIEFDARIDKTTVPTTAVYLVTEKGKFQFVSCTWNN